MSLSKRQRRKLRKQEVLNPRDTVPQKGMVLNNILPKTESQKLTFDSYDAGYNLFLHGSPGTGKTFLSIYLALEEIFHNSALNYHNLTIIRSAQPSKDMGFLPGTEKEKMAIYEAPYKGICSDLFNRGDAYDILKLKGLIDFQSTSFLRGTTINDSIVVIDECQNLSYMELKTVLTRIGDNSKVILCGDLYQDDLTSTRFNEQSGLSKMMTVLDNVDSIKKIEFGIDDIVRSGFVKQFIIAESQLSSNQLRLAS